MNVLKIAKSYIKNKNQNGMSKFQSWLAIIGITIGVTAFIVVSSVMSGLFQKIYTNVNYVSNYDISLKGMSIEELSEIKDLIGYNKIENILVSKKIDKTYSFEIDDREINLIITDNPFFSKEGVYIHNDLNINKKAFFIKIKKRDNDKVEVLDQDLFPVNILTDEEISKYPIGLFDIYISKNTFENSFGTGYSFNNLFVFKLKDFMDVVSINKKIEKKYVFNVSESDDSDFKNKKTWLDNEPKLFENLILEYTVIKIVLFFIILMSSFSIMSTITLIISEKKQDIYILKTIGYSDTSVVSIFLASGILIGVVGILSGLLLGFVISTNLKYIIEIIEYVLHIELIPNSLEYFPVILKYSSFINISCITLFIIVLSSLLPALKTINLSPAEGLKSE